MLNYKPELIDELVSSARNPTSLTNINGKWYIAKSLNKKHLLCRIYHAYLIMINKAFAVQFANDYLKED